MCGRYVATTDAEGLTRFLVVDAQRGGDLPPSWNVAPTAQVPGVLAHDGRRVLTDLRWGLIPSWAKDPSIGARMINARADTIDEKRAFADSFAQRRCLLPADGFYEWQKVDDGTRRGARLPWFVTRTDGAPMVFAGIWASWRDRTAEVPEGGEPPRIISCSIITTDANGVLAPIHDRMPVVLPRERWDAWLDPQADPLDLKPLLAPADDDAVRRRRVSTDVNRVANDGPELLEPLPDEGLATGFEAPAEQPSLFD